MSSYRSVTGSSPSRALPALEGSLRNLTSETIDVRSACLTGRFGYRITTDVAGTLHLSDGRTIRLHPGTNTGVV